MILFLDEATATPQCANPTRRISDELTQSNDAVDQCSKAIGAQPNTPTDIKETQEAGVPFEEICGPPGMCHL